MLTKSPLGAARGLGSAKSGFHHWWMQRLTALALIPLLAWFIYSVMTVLLAGTHSAVFAWLHSPVAAILLGALIVAMFWHAKLGLQVVIEDYVHTESCKITLLILINFSVIALSGMALFAIGKIHLSDPPVIEEYIFTSPTITLPPTPPEQP